MNFCWDQKGRRGRRKRDALWCIFVFLKQIFHWHVIFYFGICAVVAIPKIEFVINFFYKGIQLNFWIWIRMIWLNHQFFGSRWKRRHVNDCKDTLQTSEWKNHKIWLAIQFCPWDFRTCPHPKDISVTYPWHLQLSWSSCPIATWCYFILHLIRYEFLNDSLLKWVVPNQFSLSFWIPTCLSKSFSWIGKMIFGLWYILWIVEVVVVVTGTVCVFLCLYLTGIQFCKQKKASFILS